jgi:hypothetical protein
MRRDYSSSFTISFLFYIFFAPFPLDSGTNIFLKKNLFDHLLPGLGMWNSFYDTIQSATNPRTLELEIHVKINDPTGVERPHNLMVIVRDGILWNKKGNQTDLCREHRSLSEKQKKETKKKKSQKKKKIPTLCVCVYIKRNHVVMPVFYDVKSRAPWKRFGQRNKIKEEPQKKKTTNWKKEKKKKSVAEVFSFLFFFRGVQLNLLEKWNERRSRTIYTHRATRCTRDSRGASREF